MLRLDEAIAVVAQTMTAQYVGQYLGGGTDMRVYGDLGRREARLLSLVYQLPSQEDSIAKDLDSDIRRRWKFVERKLIDAA